MFDFFKKFALGLDISDYSIEIIFLRGSIKNPQLLNGGRVILEPGIVENNQILNKEKLKSSLQALIKSLNLKKINKQRLVFSIPEPKIFISILELPKDLKKQEKLELIKSRVAQSFPYSLEDLYLDFKIRDNEVLLVAAPKNIVDDFSEVLRSCGLNPMVIEPESESLSRSLIKDQKETVLIVDIGAKATNFSIFDEKGLRMSISIDIAGNRFTQILSEKLGVPYSKAEDLKKEIGLNPELEQGKVFLILQQETWKIIEEIKKIKNYFQEKEAKKITRVILAGGSANLPYLSEYLTDNLEIPTSIGDPWIKVNKELPNKKENLREVLEPNSVLFATATGLALRGLTKNPEKEGINLLKEISPSEKFFNFLKNF